MPKQKKENHPLTSSEVVKLLRKRSYTANEAGRLLFYYLAEMLNGGMFDWLTDEDGNRIPILTNEDMANINRKVTDRERDKYSLYVRFYIAVNDTFTRKTTYLQRKAYREARSKLYGVLAQHIGAMTLARDAAHMMDKKIEFIDNVEADPQKVFCDFLLTQEGEEVAAPFSHEPSDFAEFSFQGGDKKKETPPIELVNFFIADFYAQKTLFELASKLYSLPELYYFNHPFRITHECEKSSLLYNRARLAYWVRLTQARQNLQIPEIHLEELKPRHTRILETEDELRNTGFISSITACIDNLRAVPFPEHLP